MSLQSGVRCGDYEPISVLGTGACAEVWLADKIGLGDFRRRVAIKILKDDRRGDDEMFKALQFEARICAQLDHPNIVQVIAVETLGDSLAVVMEFVSGGTLKDFLARSVRLGVPLPTSIVLSLGRDIASALAYAHSAPGSLTGPVIHRDLKPANILLDESSAARIADFGIAKVIGDATSTETGMFKGTPAYSAPEVWEDERNFSPATDLFSLGCLLYEMVTLERLFAARSVAAIFGQIAKGDPVEEASHIQEIIPDLVPLLERLLQRKPSDRLRSGDEVVRVLDNLILDHAAEAPAPWLYEALVGALELPKEERDEDWRPPVIPPALPTEWMVLASKALPLGSGGVATPPKVDDDEDNAQTVIDSAMTHIANPASSVAEPRVQGRKPRRQPSPKPSASPAPYVEFLPEGSTVYFGPKREQSDRRLPFSATVTAALIFATLTLIIVLTTLDCS